MRSLIIGGFVLDLLAQIFSRAGRKVYLELNKIRGGGGARNVGLALKALGLDVATLGAVGNDSWGQILIRELEEKGIDVSYIQKKNTVTGFSFITDKRIESLRGANERLSLPEGLDLMEFDWIYVASIQTQLQKVLYEAFVQSEQLPQIYLNPGAHQMSGEGREDLLRLSSYAEVLQVNLKEAGILCNRADDPADLACQLCRIGFRTAIVTAGDEGAWAAVGEELFHQPPLLVEPVDPTGAGDAFASGTLAGLARGLPLHQALAIGAANGTAVLSNEGVKGFLTWEEALQRASISAG